MVSLLSLGLLESESIVGGVVHSVAHKPGQVSASTALFDSIGSAFASSIGMAPSTMHANLLHLASITTVHLTGNPGSFEAPWPSLVNDAHSLHNAKDPTTLTAFRSVVSVLGMDRLSSDFESTVMYPYRSPLSSLVS